MISKVSSKKSKGITQRTNLLIEDHNPKTITNDNGREFADHQNVNCPVYFCDPYSSWQRGTNENRIGIIRRFLPKGTDLNKLHGAQIKKIERLMNNMPLKCLDWKTPFQVHFGCNTN